MNCTRCYFALFMLICFDLTAQIVSIEEIIGIDSTYIKENYKGAIYGKESYAIRNKNALFKDTESYFIEYAQLRGSYPVIEISSKEEFDVYVKVFFAPFFKEVEGENLDRKYLTITLFSDIEGKMTDLRFIATRISIFLRPRLSSFTKPFTEATFDWYSTRLQRPLLILPGSAGPIITATAR
ncbi:MAG TPA: hypothetical protein VKY45_09255 [Marinilabiliaceae bacterium]|nr:hypothetical protein [Marinilabiliaceae bacterium]